jgi:hypothetical protein
VIPPGLDGRQSGGGFTVSPAAGGKAVKSGVAREVAAMRRTAVILVLGLLAAGCGEGPGGEASTTLPSVALDPNAPEGSPAVTAGIGWDSVVGGETWVGRSWRATAGGPVEVSYLGGEGCAGWTSVAPVVEYRVPAVGGQWVFSFGPDIPVVSGSPSAQDAPQGLVMIVRGPNGGWRCNGEYQDWQYFPGPAVEYPSAQAGSYHVWVAAASKDASVGGSLVVMTPAANYPSTTTTVEGTEASTWPTTTTDPGSPSG